MFTIKPTAIVYVLRNELIAYGKQGRAIKSPLSLDVVHFLEVVDRGRYGDAVSALVTTANLRGQRILLVMSEGTTFQLDYDAKDDGPLEEFLEEFSDKLPLDPVRQTIIAYRRPGGADCWATNKDLYQLLVDRLDSAGGKVIACVPATFFGVTGDQALDDEHRNLLFDKLKIGKSPNFLSKQ